VKNASSGFRSLITFTLVWIALGLLSACNTNTRMSTFDTKGPVAQTQYELFMVTVWVTAFIFVVVGAVFLWVTIKFRETKHDTRPLPAQGHGNPLVEVGLIGASILLLVIVAVPTVQAIWYTHDIPNSAESALGQWYPGEELTQADTDDILTIRVEGYQWWWAFDYPQFGVTSANEMILPAGKVIRLELRSKDVIHSFWLPRIAGKVDLIPGRANQMWIQAGDSFQAWQEAHGATSDDETLRAAYAQYLEDEIYNYYYGQCAEYCGDSHARMLFRATVVSDADFATWISEMKQGHDAPEGLSWEQWYAINAEEPGTLSGDIHEGLQLFMTRGKCATCHAVNGNPRALGIAGPNLTKLASRHSIAAGWLNHRAADGSIDLEQQYKNFYKWIKEPDIVKPGNLMWKANGGGIGELDTPLSDEEIRKISLYLQTLK